MKLNSTIIIDTSSCKYDIVRFCAKELAWEENENESDDWSVYWIDTSVAPERLMKMKSFQKINHFPGMNAIARKTPLARNLNRMKKIFPQHYNFFPASWVLPYDASIFKRSKQLEGKTYIIKPSAGCQGRGIVITKDREDVDKFGDCVVQLYLEKPFLLDGYKFDLRVYCLLLSVDPVRIYLFNDGLVRLCTEKYRPPTARNLKVPCMHLTNYSINKHSDKFEASEDFSTGAKRNFGFLNGYLKSNGHDVEKIWERVADVIIKTIIPIQPMLQQTYRSCMSSEQNGGYMCFEILGFDIIFDEQLNPILLEVNHSPSFNTDTPIDKHIKHKLLLETMRLIAVDPNEKTRFKKYERALAKERITGVANPALRDLAPPTREEQLEERIEIDKEVLEHYKLIYPCADAQKYEPFFEESVKYAQSSGLRSMLLTSAPQKQEMKKLGKENTPTTATTTMPIKPKTAPKSSQQQRRKPIIIQPLPLSSSPSSLLDLDPRNAKPKPKELLPRFNTNFQYMYQKKKQEKLGLQRAVQPVQFQMEMPPREMVVTPSNTVAVPTEDVKRVEIKHKNKKRCSSAGRPLRALTPVYLGEYPDVMERKSKTDEVLIDLLRRRQDNKPLVIDFMQKNE